MRFNVGPLPQDPLAAAAAFHGDIVPRLLALTDALSLTLVFPPADHPHCAWREAAIQTLAREKAPLRINALASADEAAIAFVLEWIEQAPGVTGQYFALDGQGAGPVIKSPE